jgi:hypothetical protein
VLRGGTFFFGEAGLGTITLSAADSGLSVSSFPGEQAWLSGGLALPPAAAAGWTPLDVSGGKNGYVLVKDAVKLTRHADAPFPAGVA